MDRILRSFPTRRSSDLSVPIVDLGCGNGRQSRYLARYFDQVIGADVSPSAIELARQEDRKSTRLNSSHSQISYAVFCLKKKNTDRKWEMVQLMVKIGAS